MPGCLYLVPNTLGGDIHTSVPEGNTSIIQRLKYWIAENPKSARDFLKRIGTTMPLQSIRIERLDKNTPPGAVPGLLSPVLAGEDAGLLSEAGCPAIADPGSTLVRVAHANAVLVQPLVGPSALILALMASGLEGQRFNFHGYLPVPEAALEAKLRLLEIDSRKSQSTQIFIETPYRNLRLLRMALRSLSPTTRLCIASNLTLPNEKISTRTIAQWQTAPTDIENDSPAVFLLLSGEPGPLSEPSSNRARKNSRFR